MRQQQQHALLHQQQQAVPAPPASPGRQQGPEDTLAGDLEVLSQHLQTARICQQNKASMLTAVSPAGPAGASPPPSAAMQFAATGAHAVQVRWLLRRPCSRLWAPGKKLILGPPWLCIADCSVTHAKGVLGRRCLCWTSLALECLCGSALLVNPLLLAHINS